MLNPGRAGPGPTEQKGLKHPHVQSLFQLTLVRLGFSPGLPSAQADGDAVGLWMESLVVPDSMLVTALKHSLFQHLQF